MTFSLDSPIPGRAILIRAALVTAWLAAAVLGFAILLGYDATSEAWTGDALLRWPSDSALRTLVSGRTTVVVFLHPKCPCSSATLDELESIVGQLPQATDVRAVFVLPAGAPAQWKKGALRERAEHIARVQVEDDVDGAASRRFGATASGTTFVFDGDGRLVFRGGITRSRGHAGDNPGRRSVVALGTGAVPESEHTPVFGCPLADEACRGSSESR